MKAASLERILAAEDSQAVHASVLALIREWLDLHNAFYAHSPLAGADAEAWQERALEVNQLLRGAFRSAREKNLAAVREAMGKLDELVPRLDRLVGIPECYYRIAKLRAIYAAFLEAKPAPTRRWLDDRLDEAAQKWERLAEKDRPKPLASLLDDIPGRIKRIREATDDDRRTMLADETRFLAERLAALDAKIGKAEPKK